MAHSGGPGAGCVGMEIDTMSFQAIDFYRRNGFKSFAKIDNYEDGHQCILFTKSFL